jgi:propanol-preferring alcohol dehydrogenase
MKAMLLKEIRQIKEGVKPLELVDLPVPKPKAKQILIKVLACGVCRTELDQIEGRIAPPKLPVILGHQPVGVVGTLGEGATKFRVGDRVGVSNLRGLAVMLTVAMPSTW